MSQAPQQSAAPDVQMPSKPPFWRDPEKRALVFQALALGFVFYLGYSLVSNTMANLERQGIASGFDFLSVSTGFSIAESLIFYDEDSSYLDAFFVGLGNTIYVSIVGIILATILGLRSVLHGYRTTSWSRVWRLYTSTPCVTCLCCCRSSFGISRYCGPCPNPEMRLS